MKIFDKDGKYNFVDENNVFVGYDNGQSCCENAGWFISTSVGGKEIDEQKIDFENYTFDVDFFVEVDDAIFDNRFYFDAGGCVAFRIVDNENELFLHLYNCHNGYYGHGFKMNNGEKEIHYGCL